MALSELLSPGRVLIDVPDCKRREVINLLAECFAADLGGEPSGYAEPLLEREKLGSTAIGKGIALPHGKMTALKRPAAAVAVLKQTCKFPTPDNVDVDIVIAFLSPDGPPQDVTRIGDIVRELRDAKVVEALRTAETPEQLMQALRGTGTRPVQ